MYSCPLLYGKCKKWAGIRREGCALFLRVRCIEVGIKLNQNDMERFFSGLANGIQANPIRKEMLKLDNDPTILQLSGGAPSESAFPIGDKLTFQYKHIEAFDSETKNVSPKIEDITIKINKTVMCNYGNLTFNSGLPDLVTEVTKLSMQQHNIEPKDRSSYSICMSSGSTSGMAQIVDLISKPGDVVLCAARTYPGIFAATRCKQRLLKPIEMDDKGLSAVHLRQTLIELKSAKSNVAFLYTVPTGQNPTTKTIPSDRRKEIYAVCQEFDIPILADDPYFFLDLSDCQKEVSFLELDAKAEKKLVIRLDSFSKILFPGLRLGFVTAPKDLIAKYIVYTQNSSWALSGLNQAICYGLIKQGLDSHIDRLKNVYKARRNCFLESLKSACVEDGLIKGVDYDYDMPRHGMFLWLKVLSVTVSDLPKLKEKLLENKLSFMPGSAFSPTEEPSNAFRVSFSFLQKKDFQIAAKIFSSTLVEFNESVGNKAKRAKLG